MAAKLTKASVNYRTARPLARQRCVSCVMFRQPGSCTLVAGRVRAQDTCDRWAAKR